MTGPVRAADVVVGLLTENTPRMLAQAIRLLRSIRWFGGEFARVRVVVCGVGALETGARAQLESLGAELRTVTRFHPVNPTANKLQMLAELLDAPEPLLLMLDCDTVIVRDPLPYLKLDVFQGKIAPTPTVTDEVFERLFAHFEIPKPPRAHVTPFDGTMTIPYFNSGVLAIPAPLARKLAPLWRQYNLVLADHPELVAPCQRHMNQASLALALAASGIPYAELPAAMNYQINATHVPPPRGYPEIDPVIIHYHHLATDDGFLLPTPYPGAQARIELFNERMRAEGFVPEERATSPGDSRPILVLGMHRSGTSLVAELLSAMGSYAGRPDELTPADMFNPTGYWEYQEAVRLDKAILKAMDASWFDAARVDVSRLHEATRAKFLERARAIAGSLQGRESFVLKDPSLSLLFPLWREALRDPVCVIAWRDPFAVAQSLATRDRWPLLAALASWEHYNRTLLRDTEGVPRVLVSYEELLADPARVLRELCATLMRFGVRGLRDLPEERIRQSVKPDFNRSGRKAAPKETLLDANQRALLDALRSGDALRTSIPPTAPLTLELLTEFAEGAKRQHEIQRQRDALQLQVSEMDLLLGAVFDSRTWRTGHTLLRLLKRGKAISAEDRWREMKRNGRL